MMRIISQNNAGYVARVKRGHYEVYSNAGVTAQRVATFNFPDADARALVRAVSRLQQLECGVTVNMTTIAEQPGISSFDVNDIFNNGDLAACCRVIHQLNINAGWWTDIETGERIMRRDPYLIAELLHSELSEGFEGWRKGLKDDHLPQYDMLAVELVDTFIRACDYLGGEAMDAMNDENLPSLFEMLHDEKRKKESVPKMLSDMRFLINDYCIRYLTVTSKCDCIGGLAVSCYTAVVTNDYPFMEILAAKLAYNINRADHKIKNRQKNGGKKF